MVKGIKEATQSISLLASNHRNSQLDISTEGKHSEESRPPLTIC